MSKEYLNLLCIAFLSGAFPVSAQNPSRAEVLARETSVRKERREWRDFYELIAASEVIDNKTSRWLKLLCLKLGKSDEQNLALSSPSCHRFLLRTAEYTFVTQGDQIMAKSGDAKEFPEVLPKLFGFSVDLPPLKEANFDDKTQLEMRRRFWFKALAGLSVRLSTRELNDFLRDITADFHRAYPELPLQELQSPDGHYQWNSELRNQVVEFLDTQIERSAQPESTASLVKLKRRVEGKMKFELHQAADALEDILLLMLVSPTGRDLVVKLIAKIGKGEAILRYPTPDERLKHLRFPRLGAVVWTKTEQPELVVSDTHMTILIRAEGPLAFTVRSLAHEIFHATDPVLRITRSELQKKEGELSALFKQIRGVGATPHNAEALARSRKRYLGLSEEIDKLAASMNFAAERSAHDSEWLVREELSTTIPQYRELNSYYYRLAGAVDQRMTDDEIIKAYGIRNLPKQIGSKSQ